MMAYGEAAAVRRQEGAQMWVKRVRIESSRFPRRDVYPFSIPALRQDQELRSPAP